MKKISADEIVKYLQSHTWSQTAEHFKISEMTISRKLKRLKLVNVIDNSEYINLLKKGFNRLLKKNLKDMKTSELRLVFFILSGKSISMKKVQYIKKISRIAGVRKFVRY